MKTCVYIHTHKNFCHKIKDKLVGAIWGFCDGLATGALSGCVVTGKGGWIAGLLGQIFGAFFGACGGAFSGTVGGLVFGREKIESKFQEYRIHYGLNNGFSKKIN